MIYMIDRLSANGRRVTVRFYLTNGAGIRKCRTSALHGFGIRDCPRGFNYKIIHDHQFRLDYQQLMFRLNPIIEHAFKLGAGVIVVPGLEDQMDDAAFYQAYILARVATYYPTEILWCRNPSGGGGWIPEEACKESHIRSSRIRHYFGVISTDGTDFEFPGERSKYGNHTKLANIIKWMINAGKLYNIFELWNSESQGSYGGSVAADKRNYHIYSPSEKQQLINFLRN